MNRRIDRVLVLTAVMMWFGGCRSNPTATAISGVASQVTWRQLSSRTLINFQQTANRESLSGTLMLEIPAFKDRQVVASWVELTSMKDSQGYSYIKEYPAWFFARPHQRPFDTYPPALMTRYRVGVQWAGMVRMNLVELGAMPVDVAELSGSVRLLEAVEVAVADLNLDDTNWQKMIGDIEIRLHKLHAHGNAQMVYSYTLRSVGGQVFLSLGGVPSILGSVAVSVSGDATTYFESSQGLLGDNRTGNITLPNSASLLRMYIATRFAEHTLPFAFTNITAVNNSAAAKPKTDETRGAILPPAETAVVLPPAGSTNMLTEPATLRPSEVTYACTIDPTMSKPLNELKLYGRVTLDRNRPVVRLQQPIVDRIVDADGTTIELPDIDAPNLPAKEYRSNSSTQIAYDVESSRTDLPRLPRQAQRIEGHMTVVVADDSQPFAFEKLEKDQELALPGGASLKLCLFRMSGDGYYTIQLDYAGPYRLNSTQPGEATIADVCLIDDRADEIRTPIRIRIDNNPFRSAKFRASVVASYKLPAGRTARGLRVYFTSKTQTRSIPFAINLTQPLPPDSPNAE
ncbi:MAG: hypothetical protein ACYC26_11445 [Phycisphaerales bacterium]